MPAASVVDAPLEALDVATEQFRHVSVVYDGERHLRAGGVREGAVAVEVAALDPRRGRAGDPMHGRGGTALHLDEHGLAGLDQRQIRRDK
jgi:hypothetical protein